MIFIIEFFRHYEQQNDPITALTHTQTLTWTDLAQWYCTACHPQLKRTARDVLQSIAHNIETQPKRHPPEHSP